jgi:hypothetical protein
MSPDRVKGDSVMVSVTVIANRLNEVAYRCGHMMHGHVMMAALTYSLYFSLFDDEYNAISSKAHIQKLAKEIDLICKNTVLKSDDIRELAEQADKEMRGVGVVIPELVDGIVAWWTEKYRNRKDL